MSVYVPNLVLVVCVGGWPGAQDDLACQLEVIYVAVVTRHAASLAWERGKVTAYFVIVFIHTSYIHAADTVALALAAFQQRQVFNWITLTVNLLRVTGQQLVTAVLNSSCRTHETDWFNVESRWDGCCDDTSAAAPTYRFVYSAYLLTYYSRLGLVLRKSSKEEPLKIAPARLLHRPDVLLVTNAMMSQHWRSRQARWESIVWWIDKQQQWWRRLWASPLITAIVIRRLRHRSRWIVGLFWWTEQFRSDAVVDASDGWYRWGRQSKPGSLIESESPTSSPPSHGRCIAAAAAAALVYSSIPRPAGEAGRPTKVSNYSGYSRRWWRWRCWEYIAVKHV